MILSLIGYLDSPLMALALLIGFLFALFITMPSHEFAHAHAAYREGDLTAKSVGRFTLAPFAHVDISGLLLLLFFGIGFAKPVPVDYRNLKRGKKSELRVALAGILTNFALGIIFCFLYCLIYKVWPALFLSYGFLSNLYFFFFQYISFGLRYFVYQIS